MKATTNCPQQNSRIQFLLTISRGTAVASTSGRVSAQMSPSALFNQGEKNIYQWLLYESLTSEQARGVRHSGVNMSGDVSAEEAARADRSTTTS